MKPVLKITPIGNKLSLIIFPTPREETPFVGYLCYNHQVEEKLDYLYRKYGEF